MAARLVTKKLNGSVVPPPVELLLAVTEPPPLVAEPPPLVAEPPPLVAEPPPLVAEPPPLVAEPPPLVAEPPPLVAEPPPLVAEPPELDDAPVAPSLAASASPLEQPSTCENSAMVTGSHRER
ncbi:hypothetical protein [Sorangium cellulosum]|uniref:hypothetical protein n=1 Tax=Sorangium cellulosum TaxID=56 RepID=UPI0012DB34E8|nr:hypothetical protein [Sorangium cellulosum]